MKNTTDINILRLIKTAPKLAYSYIRWSCPKQTAGTSRYRQEGLTKMVCDKLGLTLVEEVRDEGISAKDGNNLRANFASLMDKVQPNEYVIVEEWSRLSRAGHRTAIRAIEPLLEKGIKIVICTEDANGEPLVLDSKNIDDSNVYKRLVDGFAGAKKSNDLTTYYKKIAWKARKESVSTGQYTIINCLPRWLRCPRDDNGDFVKNASYIVNDDKVKVINRVFTMYVNGFGIKRIAKTLNIEHTPTIYKNKKTSKDGHWTESGINQLLRNEAVIGICKWVDPPAKIFPVIVDEKLFNKARYIMSQRNKQKRCGRIGRIVNLFTGLVCCSGCKDTLVIKGNANHERYLACTNVHIGTCKCNKTIRLDRFEASCKEIIARFDIIKARLMQEEKPVPSNIPNLETALDTCRKKRKRLYDALQDLSVEPPADIKEVIAKLTLEERQLLKDVEVETARLKGSTPVSEAMKNYKKTLADKWDQPEYRYQIREFLREIVESIIVDTAAKTYEVQFKGFRHPIKVKLNYHDCEINGIKFNYNL